MYPFFEVLLKQIIYQFQDISYLYCFCSKKYDGGMSQTGWPVNFYYDNGQLQEMSTGYEISNATSREDYRAFSSQNTTNYQFQGNFQLLSLFKNIYFQLNPIYLFHIPGFFGHPTIYVPTYF